MPSSPVNKRSPGSWRREGSAASGACNPGELRLWVLRLSLCPASGVHFGPIYSAWRSPAFCVARVAGIYGRGALCAAKLAEADGFLAASSKRTSSRSTGWTRCVVRHRGWFGNGHHLLGCRGVSHSSAASPVDGYFGQGVLPSIGHCFLLLFAASFYALFYFALLSVMTGLLRRPRLGLVAIAVILLLLNAETTAVDFALTVLFVLLFLGVLVRIGLVAAAAFFFILLTLGTSPPLILDQWYAGRAMIALLAPLALLFWGFYVSLGSQPVFGSALRGIMRRTTNWANATNSALERD